jgi:hypothetical protein
MVVKKHTFIHIQPRFIDLFWFLSCCHLLLSETEGVVVIELAVGNPKTKRRIFQNVFRFQLPVVRFEVKYDCSQDDGSECCQVMTSKRP